MGEVYIHQRGQRANHLDRCATGSLNVGGGGGCEKAERKRKRERGKRGQRTTLHLKVATGKSVLVSDAANGHHLIFLQAARQWHFLALLNSHITSYRILRSRIDQPTFGLCDSILSLQYEGQCVQ